MNSKFTDEQIKAYAAQFREGDAIWCGGKWNEVTENEKFGDDRVTVCVSMNPFAINNGETGYDGFGSYTGFVGGFERDKDVDKPYRVTTLEHYELQGGEKIVWLGESDGSRTFGKTYNVNVHSYYNDESYVVPISSSDWGIIPQYKQVKNNKPINTDIALTLKDIEKLNQFNSVFHDSKHLVELLDSLGNHEQANELMQNLLSVKEVVDNVDKQRNQIAKELMRKECNL